MAKTIQFKRGNSQNLGNVTPKDGEPIFLNDTKELLVGASGAFVKLQKINDDGSLDAVPFSKGNLPPSNTNVLWIDTSNPQHSLKYYNESEWVPLGGLDYFTATTYFAGINHDHNSTYAQKTHEHDWSDLSKNGDNKIENSTIIDLLDVPTYNGQQNKVLGVNSGGSQLEWKPMNVTFDELSDVQNLIYQEQNRGKFLRIKTGTEGSPFGVEVQDVTLEDINNKEDKLLATYGKDPTKLLTSDDYDINEGIPRLTQTGKIKLTQIPDDIKSIKTYDTYNDADAGKPNKIINETTLYDGMLAIALDTGIKYVYSTTNTSWTQVSDSVSLNLDWSNIQNKPSSTTAEIDQTVSNNHSHTNKSILDNVEEPYTTSEKNKLQAIEENSINQTTQDGLYLQKGTTTLKDLSDVIDTLNPQENEGLVFKSGKWTSTPVLNAQAYDTDLNGIIDLSENSMKLNGKEDTYFNKKIIQSSVQPDTQGMETGDLWIDLSKSPMEFYRYNGTTFDKIAGADITGSLQAEIDKLSNISEGSKAQSTTYVDTAVAGAVAPDMSNYYNKTETDDKFNLKQDNLPVNSTTDKVLLSNASNELSWVEKDTIGKTSFDISEITNVAPLTGNANRIVKVNQTGDGYEYTDQSLNVEPSDTPGDGTIKINGSSVNVYTHPASHTVSQISDIDSFVDGKISAIVDSAPETLNTLNELSQALGDDPNFQTTITTSLGNKADKSELHSHVNKTVLDLIPGDVSSNNNQFLKVNSTGDGFEFGNPTQSGLDSINDINDVNLISIENNDIMRYDNVSSKFINDKIENIIINDTLDTSQSKTYSVDKIKTIETSLQNNIDSSKNYFKDKEIDTTFDFSEDQILYYNKANDKVEYLTEVNGGSW